MALLITIETEKPRDQSDLEAKYILVLANPGLLSQSVYKQSQTGLFARCVAFVNQIPGSGLVKQTDYGLILFTGSLTIGQGAKVFDGCAQVAPIYAISKALPLGCFHSLDTGLMIWQYLFLSSVYYQFELQYNRKNSIVNK